MKPKNNTHIVLPLLLIISAITLFVPLIVLSSADVPYIASLWAAIYLSIYAVEGGYIGFFHSRDWCKGSVSWIVILIAPISLLSTFWITGFGGADALPDAVIRDSFRMPGFFAAVVVAVIGFIIGGIAGEAARETFYVTAYDHLVETASKDYGLPEDEIRNHSTVQQISEFIHNKKGIDHNTISDSLLGKLKVLGAGFDKFNSDTDFRSLASAAKNPDGYLNSEFLRISLHTAEMKFGVKATELNELASIKDIAHHIAMTKSVSEDMVKQSLISEIISQLSISEDLIDSDRKIR